MEQVPTTNRRITIIPLVSSPSRDTQTIMPALRADTTPLETTVSAISGEEFELGMHMRKEAVEQFWLVIEEGKISHSTAASDLFGWISARTFTRWILDPGGMSINRGGRGGMDASVQHHKHPYRHKATKMTTHQAPSLNHLAPDGEATPKEATLSGTPAPAAGASRTLVDHASSSAKRKDKQVMTVEETGEEVQPIIINMSKARGTARVRLLAVGVLLSVVAITSKQLINYMRNVWKVRGTLETNQYADKRFVIEFSEEGDFEHVICGGPWRYKDDAVLVRKLKEGEDPETAQFDSVPIWVQYKGIPFYLLTKALARDLGRRTGEFICIDNNARGDICDKILRARILMPLGRPLLRGIPIEDEFTDEEVMVSLRYERLPTFCLFCGLIGHSKQNCDRPETPKTSRYNPSIGVPPTDRHDIRNWFLPEYIG
ncbi:hypothetical protein ACQ4PT_061985 [Festuca glaucescens]